MNAAGQTRYYEILGVTHNKKYNSVNDVFALGNVDVDAAVKIRQGAKSRSHRKLYVQEILPPEISVGIMPIQELDGRANDTPRDVEGTLKMVCYHGP